MFVRWVRCGNNEVKRGGRGEEGRRGETDYIRLEKYELLLF